MSRPMLYATLAVLFAILIGTSYVMQKSAKPEEPSPMSQMPVEKQKEMMQSKQAEMMANEKKQRQMMQARMKSQQEQEQKKAEKLASLGVKRRATTADITDKWFKETPDGEAGIQQAIREKAIIEQVDKSISAVPQQTSSQPVMMPKAMPTAK